MYCNDSSIVYIGHSEVCIARYSMMNENGPRLVNKNVPPTDNILKNALHVHYNNEHLCNITLIN